MQKKEMDYGFTLVELVIAVVILSAILACIFSFFEFSMKSNSYVQDHYQAQVNARKAISSMNSEIRESNMAVISGVTHKAVEVFSGGMKMNVYTDIDDDNSLELVQYKIENKQLLMGTAELGYSPTSWTILSDHICNMSATIPVEAFVISGKEIKIKLLLQDENGSLKDEPISVVTSITVRNKGAM